ncbi:hypothetical protein OF83DRAFT_1168814 [Amylostereum chailletii]|nr:hypothetical protein OF83DRAFT_1168814 [Amylostereum chailletii]
MPLPPALQWKFPYNIALMVLLPFLLPAFLSLVIVRLSLASRSSRTRIKLLEKEDKASPDAGQRLIHVVAEMEREMENMVAELADEPLPADPSHSAGSSKTKSTPPRFTPSQRRMVASLNTLPQLKRELVFIDNVRNSHASIISRDVKNFEFHRVGWDEDDGALVCLDSVGCIITDFRLKY